MTDNQAPEDLGAPVAFLVLKDGTHVYDRSGDQVGTVEHVLSDDAEEVFHGLIVKAGDGHRFAPAALVDGLFEHGVIVAKPAAELPQPSADPVAEAAGEDAGLSASLKRAWAWLVQPK